MSEKLIPPPPEPRKDPIKIEGLGTAWLWLYTNVNIPLKLLLLLVLSLVMCFPFAPAFGSLSVFVFFGLRQRKWWGWNLNWWLLIAEVMIFPFIILVPIWASRDSTPYAPFPGFLHYLLYAAIYAFIWFLPNAIYFSKRKCLFVKRKEMEVLENGNIIPPNPPKNAE